MTCHSVSTACNRRRKPRIIVKRAIIQAFLFDHGTFFSSYFAALRTHTQTPTYSFFFSFCFIRLHFVLDGRAAYEINCELIGVYLIITLGEYATAGYFFFNNICLSSTNEYAVFIQDM